MRPEARLAAFTMVVGPCSPGLSRAQDVPAPGEQSAPAEAKPPSPDPSASPRLYSLPWQLRPVVLQNCIRWDNSVAFYQDAKDSHGTTWASLLTGTAKVLEAGSSGTLGALVRVASSLDAPPTGQGGFALANPLVGAVYSLPVADGFRFAAALTGTVPAGMGGGDAPDLGQKDARNKGLNARAQLDNVLFAVDDLAVSPGVSFAYIDHGLTAQVDASLIQLWRVRGAADNPDSQKTAITTGLHVGYFFVPALSVGAELRYQRWTTPPSAVNAKPPAASIDTTSVAVGPRGHFEVGSSVWIGPGLAYARGVTGYMSGTPDYHILMIDIPVVF